MMYIHLAVLGAGVAVGAISGLVNARAAARLVAVLVGLLGILTGREIVMWPRGC
jgi:xanthosine utilization system XapX-like protein